MHINDIPFPELLNELISYKPEDYLQLKVLRIHMVCIRNRKYKWAARIKHKYHRFFDNRDEVVMAFKQGVLLANILKK